MKRAFLIIVALLAFVQSQAQGVTIYGKVQSSQDQGELPGATVVLTRITSDNKTGMATDERGVFRFNGVEPGAYTVEVNYLGFKPLSKRVVVQDEAVNLGTFLLEESNTTIREVQVVGKVPLGEQKGDTVQYNAAAFKTAPDASAEDLVQKMPGITISNGTIQAQGQDVKQVLVDGKRFFGDDASTALRNLPADVIANIQIFDKKSDQAELTGVDDGNREKTINIVTKADRRNGQFGKAAAAYGTDERYMVGASINFFNGERRLTVTGITNNINMLDFSVGETPGGGMRGRRSPVGGGSTTGLISTNTLGLNYSDMWGKKLEVSANYNYNQRQNQNDRLRVQHYLLPSDSGQVYQEASYSNTTTASQRLNLRLDYKLNGNNRFLITPSLSLQQNTGATELAGDMYNANGPLNETENNAASDNTTYTFNNTIFYSHKFSLPGRTISTSLNTGFTGTEGENSLLANTFYFNGAGRNINRNQYTSLSGNSLSWSGEGTFTEPVGQHGQLQVQYRIGNQLRDNDRRTYNFEELTQGYSALDTTLSNTFSSTYLTQRYGTGYQYTLDKLRLRVGVNYQVATLQNDQLFPRNYELSHTFKNVLPTLELGYTFSKTRSLDLNYSTSTNPPSADQLQNVIDNTNPVQLVQGNPELQQSYQNNFRLGFRDFDMETNRVFFVGLFGSNTQNHIANSITRATDQPVMLSNGDMLEAGQQLIQPVNLDGYWNIRSVIHYGQPVSLLSSNVGVHGAIGYARTPGLSNGQLNYVKAPNLGLGLTLSSNISEKIDFTLSTNSSYSMVQNTLQPELNSNYFSQNTSLKYNWIFLRGLVYRTELNHQLNAGLSEGYDNNYLLWNMSISKKLLKNQQGELSLSVNDLLKQNVSIQRNVLAHYVEDVQSSVLQRYFMLTFTYNLRNFGGGAAPATDPSLPNRPRGGFPGGAPPRMPNG
ncbi:TonB-dependent receptor [Pontibacter qinzhouensis]|uniref:TonB-dependent receptor n=1 Tax=Pontibacter qinzhouensis TaxID=2603253 RepID=A0A5C8K7H9_9BACT|nr:TonB-dependent receptor [Pontibacter qinzhouensis]TXK45704.1 TonB-dependent receptor [Pontibacter qinzhouensis]